MLSSHFIDEDTEAQGSCTAREQQAGGPHFHIFTPTAVVSGVCGSGRRQSLELAEGPSEALMPPG